MNVNLSCTWLLLQIVAKKSIYYVHHVSDYCTSCQRVWKIYIIEYVTDILKKAFTESMDR